jgi:hypothetical protein
MLELNFGSVHPVAGTALQIAGCNYRQGPHEAASMLDGITRRVRATP